MFDLCRDYFLVYTRLVVGLAALLRGKWKIMAFTLESVGSMT